MAIGAWGCSLWPRRGVRGRLRSMLHTCASAAARAYDHEDRARAHGPCADTARPRQAHHPFDVAKMRNRSNFQPIVQLVDDST